jgi:hypothetical protein
VEADMKTAPAKKFAALATTVALLAAAGCAFREPGPPPREPTPEERGLKPLTGAEVRTVLNKTRYSWQAAAGATGTAITTGDGRVQVRWETGAVNGRIRFTDTGYCSRFEGVRNGVEDCYRLYRTGPKDFTVVRQDGSPSGTITLTN